MNFQAQAESPIDMTKVLSSANGEIPTDVKKFIQVLQPVWNALPSPETRASKFGQRTRSPVTTPGSPNMSLSELDVRLLKNLYDGRPAYQVVNNSGMFTIEEFAARVQALIIDDRALIERLIRFAQAHDLLKKNAERAQKLAQDSSVALETYQKQVKILEDRNMKMASDVAALSVSIHSFLSLFLTVVTTGKTKSRSYRMLSTKSWQRNGKLRRKLRNRPRLVGNLRKPTML